jgi:EAL domain-containing protein (putative c-di-GMP-specific phosphodiesterase class I)
MPATERIRVLVADDEPSVREALEALMAVEPDLDLVASASDAETAIILAARERPDVALLDVRMPGGGGERAAREIGRISPPTRVIALSAHHDGAQVRAMLQAGALAYLAKGSPAEEILGAIHRAVGGTIKLPEPPSFPAASKSPRHRTALEQTRSEQEDARERIRQVIQERMFAVAFQPIFDLTSGAVVGMEALARFSALPRQGPHRWIAEADRVGMSVDLELALAGAALQELSRLPADAYLAVNVSPRTACSGRLQEVLERREASRIVLEMTEHSQIEDYVALTEHLSVPRERGVRLAIDDIGAGFSSLRHIIKLTPEIIKLDISLTRGIDADPVRQALAAALVSFAGNVGATVVAEGVERAEELEALRTAGIGHAQGFYLARPALLSDDP